MKESFPQRDIQVDVEHLVAEEVRLTQQSETYRHDKISGHVEELYDSLNGLDPEKLGGAFQEMVERLDRETDVVTEIEDTIGKDNLLHGLADGTYPIDVAFGRNEELNPDEIAKSNVLGAYDKKQKNIRIAESAPAQELLWISMAVDIPNIMRTLDHEIVHHWFNEKATTSSKIKIDSYKDFIKEKLWAGAATLAVKSAGYLRDASKVNHRFEAVARRCMDFYFNASNKKTEAGAQKFYDEIDGQLINEVVAQKADRALGGNSDNNTISLLKTLEEDYDRGFLADKDKIIVASQVIDRLRVLGYGDKAIAEKFAEARWDKKTVSFRELERAIEKEAEQKGMTPEDLDTEADVLRLKKRVHALKATTIAQEELDKILK